MYLSDNIETIQNRCLRTIFPGHSYDESRSISKFSSTSCYWDPRERSHNNSFIQTALVARSLPDRIQTACVGVSGCSPPLPSLSYVTGDTICTHSLTEIRGSQFFDNTAIQPRAGPCCFYYSLMTCQTK